MKKLLLLSVLGILCNQVYALDIVYPKTDTSTINSPKSFFIGSADYEKPLYINGKETEVHPSGGFAQQVNLSYGKNTFEITSGSDKLVYTEVCLCGYKAQDKYRPKKMPELLPTRFAKFP